MLVGKCYVHLTPEDQYEYFGPDRAKIRQGKHQGEKGQMVEQAQEVEVGAD